MTFIVLAACSNQEVKQEPKTLSVTGEASPTADKTSTLANDALQMSGQNPAMTLTKGGKKLNLVRIMDGAACKNELEGTKGAFLLYAEPKDIARIKHEKGAKIFTDFENKIQAFSTDALQHAIDATNLSADPFALGNDEAQEKLAKQLAGNFRDAVADAITKFQQETTLTIDVTAFQPSFVFFQNGCEATQVEPDNQGAENPAP
jgi:hypothetical protein